MLHFFAGSSSILTQNMVEPIPSSRVAFYLYFYPSISIDRYSTENSLLIYEPTENSYMINVCLSHKRLIRLQSMVLTVNMVSHRL